MYTCDLRDDNPYSSWGDAWHVLELGGTAGFGMPELPDLPEPTDAAHDPSTEIVLPPVVDIPEPVVPPPKPVDEGFQEPTDKLYVDFKNRCLDQQW